MHPFILVLTEPFLALPICIFFGAFLILWYAYIAPQSWKKYSRFLTVYDQQYTIQPVLSIAGGVSLFAFFISCMAHTTSETWAQDAELSEGIYLYGFLVVSLLFFFLKAPVLEKRDLVGLHKQKTKRLEQLLMQHLQELNNQFQFEGKTKWQTQRMLSQFKNLQIEVKQEKKRRKNKHNLDRSLEQLEKADTQRRQVLNQMETLRSDIAAMYDTLYKLEAIALESRVENMKKMLNVAKEKLTSDPFEAKIYLEQVEKKEKEKEKEIV